MNFYRLTPAQLAMVGHLKSGEEVANHGPLGLGQVVSTHSHSQAALYLVQGLAEFNGGDTSRLLGIGQQDDAVLVPAHAKHAWTSRMDATTIPHVFGMARVEQILAVTEMITQTESYATEKPPGVRVLPLGGEPVSGIPQTVLVCVKNGCSIPMHSHHYPATMTVASGRARARTDDPATDGRWVERGACLHFAPGRNHGFEDCADDFSFVSINGGIVGKAWDLQLAA